MKTYPKYAQTFPKNPETFPNTSAKNSETFMNCYITVSDQNNQKYDITVEPHCCATG